jgi:hypothetical protein
MCIQHPDTVLNDRWHVAPVGVVRVDANEALTDPPHHLGYGLVLGTTCPIKIKTLDLTVWKLPSHGPALHTLRD